MYFRKKNFSFYNSFSPKINFPLNSYKSLLGFSYSIMPWNAPKSFSFTKSGIKLGTTLDFVKVFYVKTLKYIYIL